MPQIIMTTVYTIDELSDDAVDEALAVNALTFAAAGKRFP